MVDWICPHWPIILDMDTRDIIIIRVYLKVDIKCENNISTKNERQEFHHFLQSTMTDSIQGEWYQICLQPS